LRRAGQLADWFRGQSRWTWGDLHMERHPCTKAGAMHSATFRGADLRGRARKKICLSAPTAIATAGRAPEHVPIWQRVVGAYTLCTTYFLPDGPHLTYQDGG